MNYFTEQEAYERLSPFARNGQSFPRGHTSTRKGIKVNDKHSRYRQKMISEGRCPHCGKLCLPFYECQERRVGKTIRRYLKEAVGKGEIKVSYSPGKQNIYQKYPKQSTSTKDKVKKGVY